MKLSAVLLSEMINKEFHVVSQGNLETTESFLRPFLFEDGSGFSTGHICLVRTGDTESLSSQLTGPVFLIISGNLDETFSPPPHPYLVLDASYSLSRIFNFIQDLYDTYDSWDEHLSTILLSNGSIRDLLSVSLEIFHNPLSVIGLDFAPVASAGTEHIPEKYHMYSEDGLNIEYVNALAQDEAYTKMQEAADPVFYPGYITGLNTLNMNVKQDGHTTTTTPCPHRIRIPTKETDTFSRIWQAMWNICSTMNRLPLHASRTLCTRSLSLCCPTALQTIWTSASVCLPLGGAHSTTICALFSRSLTWIRKRSPQELSVIIWTSSFPIPAVFSSKRRSWPILI